MPNLLVALALVALAPAPDPGPPDPTQPVLVAKGKGYLIHAVPRSLPILGPGKGKASWAPGFDFDTLTRAGGLALLHTSTASGDMKYLIVGGISRYAGPPMNADRVYYHLFRIAGAAADAERLYVVWYHEEQIQLAGITKPPPYDGKGEYRLVVFRLSNGEKLHDLEMKEGDFPKGPPDETSDPGPLKLTNAGVSCYGVTFEFDGAELVKQRYDGKKQ